MTRERRPRAHHPSTRTLPHTPSAPWARTFYGRVHGRALGIFMDTRTQALLFHRLCKPASAVLEPAISPRLLVVLVHATHSQLLLHDAMAATGDSHGRFLHLAHLPRSSISVAACTTDVRAHGLQAQGTTRLHRPTSTHAPPAALLRRNRARGIRPLAEVARLRAWQQCREIPARVLHASAPRARRAGM